MQLKNSFYVLSAVLFLSCEEVKVDDLLSDFSTDNTPITTIITVDSTFESSSVSLNWTGNEYATSFSYRLEPLSYLDTIKTYTSWSLWDTLNTVTFTNLDEGNYTFYIKSRFTVENEETPQSISFIVDAIAGPALRMYPLYQRVTSGETFSMYVYIEDVVDLTETATEIGTDAGFGEVLKNADKADKLVTVVKAAKGVSTADDSLAAVLKSADKAAQMEEVVASENLKKQEVQAKLEAAEAGSGGDVEAIKLEIQLAAEASEKKAKALFKVVKKVDDNQEEVKAAPATPVESFES